MAHFLIEPGHRSGLLTVAVQAVVLFGVLLSLIIGIPVVGTEICPSEMALIPGGKFQIGSDNPRFLEEQSAADIRIDRFCIDRTEVTNSQFAEFVKATGYQTIAERPLSSQQFADLSDQQRLPGSLVFLTPSPDANSLLGGWHWRIGASWKNPLGPDTASLAEHPVVHIAYEDALAYANWIGKSLPTEAQWEYAARGGLNRATYAWGEQYSAAKANIWQGIFPIFNSKADGYLGTAPVGSFPPNGYGLYDMTGNVWEWTSDWYQIGHLSKAHQTNPLGPKQRDSVDPRKPQETALHVIKGGSYLCALNYCSRFRPAARESESADTGTSHIGFRLVKNSVD